MKKYHILYEHILKNIQEGVMPPGTRLPTEAALSKEHDVSRQTVRKALTRLQQEGLIYSIQGSGSYVAYPRANIANNKRFAVITTYFSEYIFPAILRGVNEVSFENGYTIEMHTTNNSIAVEKAILSSILANPVAGIIVEGTKAALPNPNTIYYKQLSQKGIPIVFINSIYPQLENEERIVSVSADDYNGGYYLAEHLIREGYTKIGCIFKSDDAQGINRFSGVIDALTKNNIPFDDRNFEWFTTETKRSFLQSIDVSNIFSSCNAIICYNDEIAEQIIELVMEDPTSTVTSVRGFDGVLKNPPIDFYSCHYPNSDIGRLLAKKLFSIISGNR